MDPYINIGCFYCFLELSFPILAIQYSYSQTPLTTRAKRVPEASKAGVGPKGNRAHFPRVSASTAPSAKLFVAKKRQRVEQKRPCLPTKAGKRRGEKRDGKHLGNSISYSTPQSVGRSAEATKACSKFCMYSLCIFPSKPDMSIVKCTLR